MGLNSREVIDKVLRSGGGRELDTRNRDYNLPALGGARLGSAPSFPTSCLMPHLGPVWAFPHHSQPAPKV